MHQRVAVPQPVRKKRRKWKRWVVLALVLVVAGGGVAALQRKDETVKITVSKAAVRDLTQIVSATGKIRPEVEVKISPEVAGEIIELPVVVGQHVKKADLLVRIKPDNYVARVKQQEAALSAAQADCLMRKAQMLNDELDQRRADDLFQKKLVPEAEFKAAATKAEVSRASYEASLHQIDVARSTLDQARDLMDKTVIYAPMDGTISVLNSEIGERVVATGDFAGTEVMRVANLGSMEARVEVNENDVVNVEVGDRVRILVDAYPGHQLRGTVKRIASTATVKSEGTQQEVTNFEVRVQVLDPDVQLRPGMSATVEVETGTVTKVVTVPVQSVTVRTRDGGKTPEELKEERERNTGATEEQAARADRRQLQRVVFLKEGNKAKMRVVETGIADNNFIEVRSGVKEGEEVVSGSYTAISKDLKDGSTVKIEEPKKNGK
jgi:HlyD family secretion protein